MTSAPDRVLAHAMTMHALPFVLPAVLVAVLVGVIIWRDRRDEHREGDGPS
jgi:hypothetical protein